MAEQFSLARPYAKAIFELAEDTGCQDQWSETLLALQLIYRDEQFIALIKNPQFSADQLKEITLDVLQALISVDNEVISSLGNLLLLMAQSKRLLVMPSVCDLYQQYLAKSRGIVKVKVSTALALDAMMQQYIQDQLAIYFDAKLDIEYQIDKKIIGGIIVRAGDWVMSSSLLGQLMILGNKLRGVSA